jgi:hypothetical protein
MGDGFLTLFLLLGLLNIFILVMDDLLLFMCSSPGWGRRSIGSCQTRLPQFATSSLFVGLSCAVSVDVKGRCFSISDRSLLFLCCLSLVKRQVSSRLPEASI